MGSLNALSDGNEEVGYLYWAIWICSQLQWHTQCHEIHSSRSLYPYLV